MNSNHEKIFFYAYSLDLLSGSKPLKIFNREKNVSLVGLVFSFILFVISIIYATINLLENYTQRNYSLISMEDNSQKVNTLKYINNETITFFRFYKLEDNEKEKNIEVYIPDFSKIFKVLVYQYNFYRKTQISNYTSNYILKNCTNVFKDDHLLKYGSFRKKIEQSLCPPNDKKLRIGYDKDVQSVLIFQVNLCNKSEDINCYSEEEIKEKYESGYLNKIYFEFYQENNIIDNDNYTTPLSITLTKLLYFIDVNYYFKASCSGKFIKYESDNGVIFNDLITYSGFRYNEAKYDIYDRPGIFNEDYNLIDINYSVQTDYTLYYKRTYTKLTTIIVDIYGIIKILFSICGFIINYSSKNYFSFKLFYEVFSKKYFDKIKLKKKSCTYNNFNTQYVSNNNLLNANIILKRDNDKIQEIKSNHVSCLHIVKNIKEREIIKIGNNLSNDVNKSNIDNSSRKVIDYEKLNKVDDEKYSKILFKYLGFDKKKKTKISIWNFVFSLFIKPNNETKIIDSCAKLVDKYLSLEQIVNNGINIDLLITNFKYENNNIDMFDKIVDNNFKENIKNIKEKMKS